MLGEKVKGLRRKETSYTYNSMIITRGKGGGLRRQERGKGDKW